LCRLALFGCRSGSITAAFPEGRQENSPGQSGAPSWDSVPIAVLRPVGGAAKTSISNLSQAAFARYLNLTSGYVSQLERGTKQPKGPALA